MSLESDLSSFIVTISEFVCVHNADSFRFPLFSETVYAESDSEHFEDFIIFIGY